MLNAIRRMFKCEQGATAVEYGLITALIAVAIISAVNTLGGTTGEMWNDVSTKVVEVATF